MLNVIPIDTTELVQVIELVIALTVACGTSVDELTATVEEFVQPDTGCVATNVYVPGAQAVVVKLVAVPQTPPNQLIAEVVGVAEPVKVTDVTPHTKVCVDPASAVGVVRLLVTVATALFVQLFTVLVVINV